MNKLYWVRALMSSYTNDGSTVLLFTMNPQDSDDDAVERAKEILVHGGADIEDYVQYEVKLICFTDNSVQFEV